MELKQETVSEETFARAESALGKDVHFHKGVWWVKSAPLYYKAVNPFRIFPPGTARPKRWKAMLGYSHQVPEVSQATRTLVLNIIGGEDLRGFRLDCLKSATRRAIRKGLRECSVAKCVASEEQLEWMRLINISQAEKLSKKRQKGTFLPSEYYQRHASQWREGIFKLFNHPGHQIMGAFVEGTLISYVDLIRIEDTWSVGAVKSQEKYLQHRPVDALYFTILDMASRDPSCQRVLNGGGVDEPSGLRHFKEKFHFFPVATPIYTWSIPPMGKFEAFAKRALLWRRRWQKKQRKPE